VCDARIKDNIKRITQDETIASYDKLKNIDIVSYDYKPCNGLLVVVVAGLFWMQQAESEGPRQSFMSSDHLWHTLGNSPA
jgi:hypothetical protein